MNDVLEDLEDLYRQATTERSHHYVASCCKRAIIKIKELRDALETCRELRKYDQQVIVRLMTLTKKGDRE